MIYLTIYDSLHPDDFLNVRTSYTGGHLEILVKVLSSAESDGVL